MSNTPFLPFAKPAFSESAIAAVAEVLRSGWVTTGPKVTAFEQALSDYFGRPTLTFANGTCTMEVALKLAGIGPGDEVITTPITWVATANVIEQSGARAVFADIDPKTRNLSVSAIEAAITPKTKALLPVHLAGLPCNLEAIDALAKKHHLQIIEDAAQAMHSQANGRLLGSFGGYASFSFQANKNLTTAEGGCLVLPDDNQLERAKRLRLQGVERRGVDEVHLEELGGKFNMTDISAALGLDQLSRIDNITEHRKTLAKHYQLCLHSQTISHYAQEPVWDFENSNWHMLQLVLNPKTLTCNRAQFITRMREHGIGIGVHYPPVHLTKYYQAKGWQHGQFPHAEYVGANIVSLPLHTSMSKADVERVVSALGSVFKEYAS